MTLYNVERCKLSQRGLERSRGGNRFFLHFGLKIRHLVASNLLFFLRIDYSHSLSGVRLNLGA